jgi:crotonobetainyl-CoA:carnitine CoA-transferase CaiB-like acyl-CoA transferase
MPRTAMSESAANINGMGQMRTKVISAFAPLLRHERTYRGRRISVALYAAATFAVAINAARAHGDAWTMANPDRPKRLGC